MKRIITPLCISVLLFFASVNYAPAQCMTLDVDLDERINSASLIVDGEVVAQNCFAQNGMIYTRNRVKVYKVLKGQVPDSGMISLVTLGGHVGDDMLEVNPSLQVTLGQSGMFMLKNWESKMYLAVYDGMGFISYDAINKTAQDIYHSYGDIKNEFLPLITGKINTEITQINTAFYEKPTFGRRAVPIITSLSASTIEAGNDKILTINGSNFESLQGTNGKVEFKDGNSGGTTWFEAIKYKSWSSTKIEVYVPSRAGTGTLRVTNINNESKVTSQSITVPFSNLNATFNDETSNPYVTQHKEDVGTNNDIIWQFNTTFFDSTDAKDAFIRSLENWRCGTLMPWNVSNLNTVVSNYEANDGINLVTWDNFKALPSNVLGRCYSRWQGCGATGSRKAYVNELDIVFNRSKNWHYALSNASGGKTDFVSVCTHELGHGHQLGHVISATKIMHFSIGANQTKRVLSTGDINGGNAVHARSVTAVCSRNAIVLLNSNNCSLVGSTVNFAANKTEACEEETIVFSDSTKGAGITWTWSFGANASPATAIGVGSHSVKYTSGGSKNVALTVTTLDGPVIETKNNYITVKNDPRVDAKAIFSNYGNNIFRFYSENGSNYTNKWFYNNDNDSLTADTIYLTFPSPGNYTVKLKASNACNDTTITINLTDWTDVVELKNTRIDVYPNPATSSIKINTQEHRFETVRILDLSGRVVLNQAFKANHNIDISTLQKGMYILQLQFNNTLISTKLIKE